MIELVTKRFLLKQLIDESIRKNKELLALFHGNNYTLFEGDENQVGDVSQLLSIPYNISLVFHTHPHGIVYPSIADVEMSITLSRNKQYLNTVFAVGSSVNSDYIVCYWYYDTIDFKTLNKIEYEVIIDGEEDREKIKEAIGLQCLNLDSISLTEIAKQQELVLMRRINRRIRYNDYVVFKENIGEVKTLLEKMYPILDKTFDYKADIYKGYKGIVHTYYFLLSVSDDKVRIAKALFYKYRIEVITMSTSGEKVVRAGSKSYTVEELRKLCSEKLFCE